MRRVILAVFAAVFLWQVYRAAVTAVSVEEAITYNQFASQPLWKIFSSPYQSENQILHTLLCRFILRKMRETELLLRWGSLLGFAVYLWAAFRLMPADGWVRSAALLICALNPFSIGWIPQSNGTWMASGFLLFGLRELVLYEGNRNRLSAASICFGVAIGYSLSFCLPVAVIALLFLHFEFWGLRRVEFWSTINHLLLPAGVLAFAIWILPMTKGPPHNLEWDWVAILPCLLAGAAGNWILKTASWKLYGAVFMVLAILLLSLGTVPKRFSLGRLSEMPRVARELRAEIRREPPRAFVVTASPDLVEVLEFYRRRYALGSVRKITSEGIPPLPDYSVAWDSARREIRLVIYAK